MNLSCETNPFTFTQTGYPYRLVNRDIAACRRQALNKCFEVVPRNARRNRTGTARMTASISCSRKRSCSAYVASSNFNQWTQFFFRPVTQNNQLDVQMGCGASRKAPSPPNAKTTYLDLFRWFTRHHVCPSILLPGAIDLRCGTRYLCNAVDVGVRTLSNTCIAF